MAKKYAELNIYLGIINNRGISEGRFDINQKDPYSENRYLKAVKLIRKTIDEHIENNGYPWIDYGYIGLINDEKKARELIKYIKEKFPKSEEILIPLDSMHGNIRFYRQIKFPDAVEENKNQLIEKITESGLIPEHFDHGKDYTWQNSLFFK